MSEYNSCNGILSLIYSNVVDIQYENKTDWYDCIVVMVNKPQLNKNKLSDAYIINETALKYKNASLDILMRFSLNKYDLRQGWNRALTDLRIPRAHLIFGWGVGRDEVYFILMKVSQKEGENKSHYWQTFWENYPFRIDVSSYTISMVLGFIFTFSKGEDKIGGSVRLVQEQQC